MRIISGSKKGRQIKAPKGDNTRPTLDRVRESIFNVLGNIEGLSMLDLFGGSGAMILEGGSRGIARGVVVERDKLSQSTIKGNIADLNLSDTIVLKCGDYKNILLMEQDPFHIIFLDPPYNKGLICPACRMILDGKLMCSNGVIVIETSSKNPEVPDCDELYLWKEKKFGATLLYYYKLT